MASRWRADRYTHLHRSLQALVVLARHGHEVAVVGPEALEPSGRKQVTIRFGTGAAVAGVVSWDDGTPVQPVAVVTGMSKVDDTTRFEIQVQTGRDGEAAVGGGRRFRLQDADTMRMSDQPRGGRIFRTGTTGAAGYLLAAAVSLMAAFWSLRLWKADLRVPFDYSSDALSSAMLVRSILKNGWYLTNPQLGAPGVLELHDYPMADGVHFLLIKLLGLFTADWALVFNLYFLLGFPLIAVSALAVLRHLRIPFGPALLASTLFSFLPSRLLKGEHHLFLDVFFQVPLAILVVLWACGEAPPLVRTRAGERSRWPALDLGRGRSIAALAICLLTASTGAYYACFAAGLLLVAGAWASIRNRATTHATAAVLLAATLAGGVALNGVPTLIHRHRHGHNPEVGQRLPAESDRFGLRISQLVLPVTGHRIEALGKLKDRYNAGAADPGEGSSAALGFLGSIGFIWLLAVALGAGPRDPGREGLLARLAAINLSAVLIATIGGFGSLFAFLVTPQIRTWSRMNVVIGFLSLSALAVLVGRVGQGRPRLALLLPPLLLLGGLLDQASRPAVRPYARTRVTYLADARFVQAVESTLPAGAMVFQLPQRSFPESPPQHRLKDYDLLRPYLHARTIRFSYPAMRGRHADLWAVATVARPLPEMLATLSDAGFSGLLVDRAGYRDDGAAIERDLATLLQVRPTVSDHARFALFSLAEYSTRAAAGLSPAEREERRTRALHPLLLRWGDGFFGLETPARAPPFRWCQRTCELQIINGAPRPRPATLSMTLVPASAPSRWTVSGTLLREETPLATAGTPYTRRLLVPPGTHTLRMTATNPPVDEPSDPRTMVWRAEAATLVEELPGGP
jgi:hypothetical protein